MLSNLSRPTIGKLTGALRSAGIVDSNTSPRSPLDCTTIMDSPKSLKKYDQHCGVGLGLVIALNNNNNINNNNYNYNYNTSNCYGGEILAKYALSSPISINNSLSIDSHTYERDNYYKQGSDDMLEEEFTYVTCHGPNKSVTTRVYYDGVDCGRVMGREIGVFNISSSATTTTTVFNDHNFSSNSNFLSSCHLCMKSLHGKDIYMYRGEKAFCSEECRQRQISIDENVERRELCNFEASRSINVSASPYSYTNNRGGIIAV